MVKFIYLFIVDERKGYSFEVYKIKSIIKLSRFITVFAYIKSCCSIDKWLSVSVKRVEIEKDYKKLLQSFEKLLDYWAVYMESAFKIQPFF